MSNKENALYWWFRLPTKEKITLANENCDQLGRYSKTEENWISLSENEVELIYNNFIMSQPKFCFSKDYINARKFQIEHDYSSLLFDSNITVEQFIIDEIQNSDSGIYLYITPDMHEAFDKLSQEEKNTQFDVLKQMLNYVQ